MFKCRNVVLKNSCEVPAHQFMNETRSQMENELPMQLFSFKPRMKPKRDVIAAPAIKHSPTESSSCIKNVLICRSVTFLLGFVVGAGRLLLPATDVESRPVQQLLAVTG